MFDHPLQSALIHVTALVAFLLSSTTGLGAAFVLMPVLTVALDARTAVALMAPILAFNSASKVFVFRRHLEPKTALLALSVGAPAAAAGALVSQSVPEAWLRIVVAMVIVAFVLDVRRRTGREPMLSPRAFTLLSIVTGFASGLSSVGGPTNAMAIRARGLVKEAFLGTAALVMLGLQLVKVPVYAAMGGLRADDVPLAISLGLCAFLSALMGRRVVAGTSLRAFDTGLQVVLLILAAWMLLDGSRVVVGDNR